MWPGKKGVAAVGGYESKDAKNAFLKVTNNEDL